MRNRNAAFFPVVLLAIVATLATASFSPAVYAGQVEVNAWGVDVKTNVDWEKLTKAGAAAANSAWNAAFTDHQTVEAVFDFHGKKVVVVQIIKPQDTRITNNIDFSKAWTLNSKVSVHVMLANVPDGADPQKMFFQQKYDKKWRSDPNRSDLLTHASAVQLGAGDRQYFAKRSDTVYEGGFILFIEDGITPDDLNQLPGVHVSK